MLHTWSKGTPAHLSGGPRPRILSSSPEDFFPSFQQEPARLWASRVSPVSSWCHNLPNPLRSNLPCTHPTSHSFCCSCQKIEQLPLAFSHSPISTPEQMHLTLISKHTQNPPTVSPGQHLPITAERLQTLSSPCSPTRKP